MKVLLILLTFCFLSSCQKENCEIPDYDLTRKVDIKINTNAEKSLNDLTQILKTGRYLKNLIPENGGCKRLENEIYFNLNQENEILHIKCIYYKNEIGLETSHYMNYDIPISQIDTNNIDISFYPNGGLFEKSAILSISSKFNNPDAFKIKIVKIENEEEKVTQCVSDSGISINLRIEDAEKFKFALINLVNNYNN